MTRFALILMSTLIAACQPVSAPVSRGGGDGMAAKLRPGMTENDAFGVFGPESGFERNPDNWDQSCLTYAYGDAGAPLYVHAVYENGVLIRATDGHPAICTFAADPEA